MGLAIGHRIGRHAHPKARPETPPAPPEATGIDYLRLIGAAHQAELARGVDYATLTRNTQPDNTHDSNTQGSDDIPAHNEIPGAARPAHR